MTGLGRARRASLLGAAACAAITTAVMHRALVVRPPLHPRWHRSNFRGRPVTLAAGPAVTAGSASAALVARAPTGALAITCAGMLGLYDDLYGDSHARGLAGHVRALQAGQVTTGMIKLAGLFLIGVTAADDRDNRWMRLADAALLAGAANLANLLDLRPGRAAKATLVAAVPLAAGRGAGAALAAGVSAAAIVALPADLGEQTMLGDCGANALGAAVGWAMTRRLRPRQRLLGLLTVTALTALSERVSFTDVIARTPILRELDEWGRAT